MSHAKKRTEDSFIYSIHLKKELKLCICNCKGYTWLVNPIPNPSKIRPKIRYQNAWAKPLRTAPLRKRRPPIKIDHFRPNFRVTVEAITHDTKAARYRDDVNNVRVWQLYWQYSLVDVSRFFFRYTDGKNFKRKGSIDVTPPDTKKKKA